ncbi:hypothetical protein COLO4_12899 [Corchorus olitorius]|uniref:Uncharacterized protein n=1 Tax=Corchorus olitorius TaxID=93759 RepID=A0A1R3JZ76_9ROSI|nr:hypothetical protein COLO4_12899 [Corchorus olitorius]
MMESLYIYYLHRDVPPLPLDEPDPDELGPHHAPEPQPQPDLDDGFEVGCGDPVKGCLGNGCPCYQRGVYCDTSDACACPCMQVCENMFGNCVVVTAYRLQHGHV